MSQPEQQFRLAEIEVNKSTLDENIIGMFRCESEQRGKRGPILLVIAEISSTLYVYEQLLDIVNGTVDQTRHLTAAVDTDPMARFEKLTERLNAALLDFQSHEPTPIAWNRVNLFVIQLFEQTICLSGIGRLMNLFLQKQADGSSRAFDLFGSLEQPAEIDPAKPFAALICGDMKPGDVLFAGTQNFERLRSELQIKERLLNLPPVTASLEIRQDLERRDIPDDFAGVVVASVALPMRSSVAESAVVEAEKNRSTASIEKMHSAEMETQAMLSPAIAPIASANTKTSIKNLAQTALEKGMGTIKQNLSRFSKKPENRDPLTMTSLRGMSAGHGSFMTRGRRMKIIGAAVVLVAILGGYLLFRHSQKVAAEQTLWNLTYNQATDKKNQAEADLLYGNEDQARKLIKEATTMLAGLDDKTQSRKVSKDKLTQDLAALQFKLKRETRVDQPQEIATLTLGSPDHALQGIATLKGQVFAVDTSNQVLLAIDPKAQVVKKITLPASSTRVIAVTSAKDRIVMITDTKQVITADPAKDKAVMGTLGMTKATAATDAEVYNNRLYILDSQGNMIWRYDASGDGFGNERAYLKQNTANFSDAKSMAIDMNVYVAFSSGKIMRYLSGVEETWSLPEIDPALTSAASIWTSPDTDRLVIADPTGKRILVFRKDGQLVSQIVSAAFQGPSFVTGDLAAKKIYAVDGNHVLAFDLP